MLSSHDYWPLKPGTYIAYDVYKIDEATYDPATLELTVVRKTLAPVNGRQIIHCVRVPVPEPVVYLVTTLPGQPIPTPDNIDQLYPIQYLTNGHWRSVDGTQDWFGEANAQRPFQPLLTTNPVVGEQFEADLHVHAFDAAGATDPNVIFKVRYGTLGIGPWSDGDHSWPDCVRTACVENIDTPANWVPINYVFAKDIGQVAYWKGVVGADGKMVPDTGYMWLAVEWGASKPDPWWKRALRALGL